MFWFSPRKFGKWSNLTNIFEMGWFNHQLDKAGYFWVVGLSRCSSEKVGLMKSKSQTFWPKNASFGAPNFGSFFGREVGISGKSRLLKSYSIWPEKSLETWNWVVVFVSGVVDGSWIWIFFGGDMFWYIHRRCQMFSILPLTIFLSTFQISINRLKD